MPESTTRFDHKRFLANLTSSPGVYQMLSDDGEVIYVGKAKNLKNRVSSYFRARGLNAKTVALVNRIASIQVTVVNSETEALLLEQNLIKAHRPHFNILMRDDKSFPYIFISDHNYPRIAYHRGAKRAKGQYFGPYPNGFAAKEGLQFLQRVFQLRPCEDSVMSNRSRPCLQHQIGRCSAPCVTHVSVADYAESVANATAFLEGKSHELVNKLGRAMQRASTELAFEKAAVLRDQIGALTRVAEQQDIDSNGGDTDILGAAEVAGMRCIQVMMVRSGRILGSRAYFPKTSLDEPMADVVSAFIGQHYINNAAYRCPQQLILSHAIDDAHVLAQVLTELSGRTVKIAYEVRGRRARWISMAVNTALENCQGRLADRHNNAQRLAALSQLLALPEPPERMECFDISHSQGELTVASCVVFDSNGPLKSDYRRFNIDGITGGDDFAAMKQALTRRYTRLQKDAAKLPDLLVIDGGKGQLTQAMDVLEELGISDTCVIGLAKGETRKSGFEQLFIGRAKTPLRLDVNSSGFHLLQHIRDEAHRFAVSGHKARRDKKRKTSTLEGIDGIGPTRRRALLNHFGGLQEVKRARVQELAKVPGFSAKMAQTVYDALHEN